MYEPINFHPHSARSAAVGYPLVRNRRCGGLLQTHENVSMSTGYERGQEDMKKAVEEAVRALPTILVRPERADDHEYIDTCLIYKALQKLPINKLA